MIATIFIGLLVGIVAKLLMPGKDPGGWIITILLGIAGSSIAHFIGLKAGFYTSTESAGFIASVLGAILILAIYRLMIKRRMSH